MKIAILKYDHRHGCDLSAHDTYAKANEARAKICTQFVDDRVYTADADDGDEDDTDKRTVSQRVKALFDEGDFDGCVEVYLKYNQDESLDIEEVEMPCALPDENARLQRELNEALRTLNKKTGMRWDNVIAQRALPWWSRKTCEACKGLGEISIRIGLASYSHEYQRCEACKGEGEIWEAKLHDPNGLPCDGCPNSNCSDYELCSRKKFL